MRSRGRITALILNLTAIILSLIFIIPMVVIFINSFKSPAESNTMSMRLPTEWMFENYSVVVERGEGICILSEQFLLCRMQRNPYCCSGSNGSICIVQEPVRNQSFYLLFYYIGHCHAGEQRSLDESHESITYY